MSGLADLYTEQIVDADKQPVFLLLVAFVVTFLFIRLSVRMIRAGVSWWPGNVQPGGLHIHHVMFGTVFVLVAGVLSFAPGGWGSPWYELLAVLFGIGAALVLDEFALILHLDDVYWSEQGRLSVDAVALGAGVTGLLVLGALPFGANDLGDVGGGRLAYIATILVNGAFVVVAILKGRTWLGVLGLVVPLLALVGAVRLARPNSPWARSRYRPGSRRLRRAEARQEKHAARGLRWKRAIYDAVGGRPDAKQT